MQSNKVNTAIIVAGGVGSRMGASLPKQFMQVKGKPVLQWSLECFDLLAQINRIILVLPEDLISEGRERLAKFEPTKEFLITAGGARRQDSVAAGLNLIKDREGLVAIHDAARPFMPENVIKKVFEVAEESGAALCALPCYDTMVKCQNGIIMEHMNRSELFRIQTPQVFKLDLMRKAMEHARVHQLEATDDSSLVMALGAEVKIVEGSELGMKITVPEDLRILENLLKNS